MISGLKIAVVERDNSRLSRTIRTHLYAARELQVVKLSPSSLEATQGRLARGELKAVVLLPAGLSARLKQGKVATVPVALDGSNILAAKNVRKALAQAIGPIAAGVLDR